MTFLIEAVNQNFTLNVGVIMKNVIGNISVSIVFLLNSLVVLGDTQGVSKTTYDYPYKDPYFASMTVGLLYSKMSPQEIVIEGLPGREDIAFFEGRGETYVEVFAQKNPAPLVYLIPGIGADSNEGTALWLGEKLFQKGFSVLIVPSAMNWRFALAQSSSAMPGYTPEDIKDLTRVIQIGEKRAKENFGLKPTRKAIVGYSLGAVEAAFIMKTELEKTNLGIERVVMINPPLRLEYATQEIDNLASIGRYVSAENRDKLLEYLVVTGEAALARDCDDPSYFQNLDKLFPYKTRAIQYLVGSGVRQSLGNTLFTTQQIHDTGVLHQPFNPNVPEYRENEAMAVSFADYMEQVALPYWQKQYRGGSLELLERQSDIMPIKNLLAQNSAFIIFHNQDDFLTDSQDLAEIKSLMGDRCYIYPTGGHLGNIWYSENVMRLVGSLEDLLKPNTSSELSLLHVVH